MTSEWAQATCPACHAMDCGCECCGLDCTGCSCVFERVSGLDHETGPWEETVCLDHTVRCRALAECAQANGER